MEPRIISNITSLKERPNAFQFLVVFVSDIGQSIEFIFIGNSLAQCVTQCTAFINYLFSYHGMLAVYIFPTNVTTKYRNVYGRRNGLHGDYRMLECKPDVPLTLADVRPYYVGS